MVLVTQLNRIQMTVSKYLKQNKLETFSTNQQFSKVCKVLEHVADSICLFSFLIVYPNKGKRQALESISMNIML